MAVIHFSALKVLENLKIFDVLVDVVQSSAKVQRQPQSFNFSFTRLEIRPASLYRSGNLGLVLGYCLFVREITIVVKPVLTDTDLLCLTNLKNLQLLYIMGHSKSTGDEITFHMGVAPVLKVIGNSLQFLDLSYFAFVDIWTIVKLCPHLISLMFEKQCQSLSVLSENEIIQLRNDKGRIIFQELKVLHCGFNLSNDILFDLLSCPLLERVQLSFCYELTDDFLQEALANGIFKNVKVLSLDACNVVTKQGLDELVINDNSLEEISFHF
jgi:hypothetical protein